MAPPSDPARADRPAAKDSVPDQSEPLILPDASIVAPPILTMVPAPAVAAPETPPARAVAVTQSPPVRAQAAASPAPVGDQPATTQPAMAQSTQTPPASTPVAVTTIGDPLAIPVTPAAPPPVEQPARAEAVSLLQLVRDHMTGRAASRRQAEGVVPTPAKTESDDGMALAAIPRAEAIAPPFPTASVAPPVMTAPVAPVAPVADLSASLGAQVVDMGVSGQWIDSLARDIAGLSANGAQGRFHITTDQLGPVQVDLRQSEAGMAISLTVETQAAEAALRQDSDRLRLDAGLAAVRISDVKIERAPVATDSARSDTAGQQSSNQQQASSQGQGSGQAMGQGLGQGTAQQQGRWQARENFAPTHKATGDGAVINHGSSDDVPGEPVRARYA